MADNTERGKSNWGRKLSRCCLFRQRVVLEVMGLLAIIVCYMTRICLSHAITVLVIKQTNESKSSFNLSHYCARDDNFNVPAGKHNWSEILQGLILSSFFIGYFVTQLPGVILTERYGGKWILTVGMFFSGLASVLSPLIIKSFGPYAFMVLRIVMGLGQGLAFPALRGIIDRWIPPIERGTLGAFIICGAMLASLVANLFSGILLARFHWSVVFIAFGGLTLIWCIFFTFLCYSYPVAHPYISTKELNYLYGEMGELGRVSKPPVPWKQILTSGSLWPLIMAQFGYDWGMSLIINDLPKYFSHILGIGVLNNGVYTSMLFIPLATSGIIFGFIGDCLILRELMEVTSVRKLMTVIAAWGAGAFMIGASYANCQRLIVIALFMMSMFYMGSYYTGIKLVPMDLSPNNAGYIAAVVNSIGTIAAFLAPTTTGFILSYSAFWHWRLAFWLAFGLLFVTGIVFLLWGTAEVQPYDEPEKKQAE
ncbi:putative inorganic phosphate cotransporter isoform X2 [Drosophila tropicalis]|uniref:putative inorganic phosphate cotransporter isoform X2 n=1 Tax=Drosophila tropicalis TaxID=46794 RepID=UPI0035ABFB98